MHTDALSPAPAAPRVSVIVCTFNRRPQLERCLRALVAQSLAPSEYEVVVVDDASSDDTTPMLRHLRSGLQLVLRRHETNGGLAAARNTGLDAARGAFIVCLDDDAYPVPHFLEAHLAGLTRPSDGWVATLGRVTPVGELARLALTYTVDRYNLFLPFTGLADGARLEFDAFLNGNIGFPRAALAGERFDQARFTRYGCEDVELGYRLSRRGMRLHYCEPAAARHDQLITADRFYGSLLANARNQVVLIAKHPALMLRYWGIAALDQDTVDGWHRAVAHLDRGIEPLLDRLRSLESRYIDDLAGRQVLGRHCPTVSAASETVYAALCRLAAHARLRGRLEGLGSAPDLCAGLPGGRSISCSAPGRAGARVSIVITGLPGPDLVATFRSVWGQTHRDFDVTVAPTTGPSSPLRGGLRNAAIAAAHGDYVLALEAGDLLAPTAVAACVTEFARHPLADVVYTDGLAALDGRVRRVRSGAFQPGPLAEGGMQGVAVLTRFAFDAAGGFAGAGCPDDRDLWTTCAEDGLEGVRLAEPLVYRPVRDSRSAEASGPSWCGADSSRGITTSPATSDSLDKRLRYRRVFNALANDAARRGLSELVIAGAGEAGREMLRSARRAGLRVPCFVDRNSLLWESRVDGVPVLPLQTVVGRGSKAFVVGSLAFVDEMIAAIQGACPEAVVLAARTVARGSEVDRVAAA